MNLNQEEPTGGSRWAGGAAIASGQDGGDGGGVAAAGAGLDEGTDEVADHVVEEAGAGDPVEEEVVDGAMPGGGEDGTAGRGRRDGVVGDGQSGAKGLAVGVESVGAGRGEAGEVMRAEDVGGGALEAAQVERRGAVPDKRGKHGRTDAVWGWRDGAGGRGGFWPAQKDAVLVGFGSGAVAGVEGGGNGGEGEYADAAGEDAIEGAVKIWGGDGCEEIEAGNLREGVDTGVGAAGAGGEGAFGRNAKESVRKMLLHGGEAGLDLPAVEMAAIVTESAHPAWHGATVARGARAGVRYTWLARKTFWMRRWKGTSGALCS